jgi:hypothetical protein
MPYVPRPGPDVALMYPFNEPGQSVALYDGPIGGVLDRDERTATACTVKPDSRLSSDLVEQVRAHPSASKPAHSA